MWETGNQSNLAADLLRAGICPVDLRKLETAAIQNALLHANGNRTRAAKSLGISVRTLQRKIKYWTREGIPVNGRGDVFIASFQGRQIRCQTVDDAIAINTANALLRNGDSATATELQRLATTLRRHDCAEGAETLSQRASRQRAAEFLCRSVGYERPR
jgi:hypothetical protein